MFLAKKGMYLLQFFAVEGICITFIVPGNH